MNTTRKTTMIACTVLAFIAASVYLLIGTNVLSIPKIGPDEAPVAIVFLAAAGYIGGGLLILLRRRWLWMVGLAANAFVIFIFFLAYRQSPEMILSTAGLTTKIAQILLEAGLLYLIVTGHRTAQPAEQAQPTPMELTRSR